MWRKFLFLIGVSLVSYVGFVKAASAQGPALPVDGGSGFIPMFLDQGFLGRDVDLDLSDYGARIKFANGELTAPGVLTFISEPETSTTSRSGLSAFGPRVHLDWTTNTEKSPTSTDLTLKNPSCGAKAFRACALEEVYQGKVRIIRPAKAVSGSARGQVRLGADVRLVETGNYMTAGDASWYAYKKCLCAASPDFPKGTYVRVTRSDDPSKTVVVRINDYGPERDKFPKRAIDLDKVAFAELASTRAGVIQVNVEPLAPDDPDALCAKASEAQSKSTTKSKSSVIAKSGVKTTTAPQATDSSKDEAWSY